MAPARRQRTQFGRATRQEYKGSLSRINLDVLPASYVQWRCERAELPTDFCPGINAEGSA
ncbi:hypothetical protein AMC99_00145 [Altererythrobacter epoxidivorans]|uniref:Uncharacterized protein n=1 Tax=Altererythrobacter epoxidivorans TaxID=361183 RepID=A0A0M5KY10_9SPHN|nr:hypothetical protein AMC99_00145 [Altererythrobacter epoxidivorans]